MTGVNRAHSTQFAESLANGGVAGKYMSFKLDVEEYAIEILHVREIIRLMEITRAPRAEPHVRGLINLRGRVIPVVDLRLKLGMSALHATEQTVIIVVQYPQGDNEVTVGVLVDEVLEVVTVGPDDFDPAPNVNGTGLATGFLAGIAKLETRVVFLLNIATALGSGEPGTGLDGEEQR